MSFEVTTGQSLKTDKHCSLSVKIKYQNSIVINAKPKIISSVTLNVLMKDEARSHKAG